MLVDVSRVVETLERLGEVEDEEDADLERDVQVLVQEVHGTRGSPAFRGENVRRSTSLPSPAGRA